MRGEVAKKPSHISSTSESKHSSPKLTATDPSRLKPPHLPLSAVGAMNPDQEVDRIWIRSSRGPSAHRQGAADAGVSLARLWRRLRCGERAHGTLSEPIGTFFLVPLPDSAMPFAYYLDGASRGTELRPILGFRGLERVLQNQIQNHGGSGRGNLRFPCVPGAGELSLVPASNERWTALLASELR